MTKTPENNFNELGLELGFTVPDWKPARLADSSILQGQHCRLEPLNIDAHSAELFESYSTDEENRIWVYLPYGPFANLGEFQKWMADACFTGDPYFYAIIDKKREKATGMASYLRITPEQGCIEVGHINYSPLLQNTVAATETMYLMMKNAFDLGNRRYEWKCNALNAKSCNAARRLGFTYEGTFRQMLVVKGQNRDSAWFSLLDREWPVIRTAFETWLSEDNFDAEGMQKRSLSDLTRTALASLEDN